LLARLYSATACGIDAIPVEVEVDLAAGLPAVVIVGLPDAAVRESRDRVKAALTNSGFRFPTRRLTVNLAPADLRKEGPLFDLPIAVGVLLATEQLAAPRIEEAMLLGELALDGRVRPVTGVLPAALAARASGKKEILVPGENAAEAAVIGGLAVRAVGTLAEAVGHLSGKEEIPATEFDAVGFFAEAAASELDFADVRGQENVKRALTVAAAGGHNVLMMGPPGAGKSMMASRLPTILPRLSLEESIETTKVHSVAGLLSPNQALVTERPFRSPHHTVSYAGLVGGGADPRPGEISFAHHGVLFLDEFPEFDRKSVEALRQPIEETEITITRASATATFPAAVTLVAAMNPCPCGWRGHPQKQCRCSPLQVRNYTGRISGPLLDRIDIHVEVPAVPFRDLRSDKPGTGSEEIRRAVESARAVQRERFGGPLTTNARMTTQQIRAHCRLDPAAENLLRQAMSSLSLSARGYTRILKVARTIADLAGAAGIEQAHLAEAVGYRTLDREVW